MRSDRQTLVSKYRSLFAFCSFCAPGLLCLEPNTASAQLVADGATNIVSGYATNLVGNLTVGTNGSFTQLSIRNTGTVTNTGDAYIGWTYTAGSNVVHVADVNSSWHVKSNLWVGRLGGGSYNRLIVTNGASVSCYNGILGYQRGNSAEITGSGSDWTMESDLAVGDSALASRLLISQGGRVADYTGYIGKGSISSLPESHLVLVTDPDSLWHNAYNLYVGLTGDYNQLVISNRGTVVNYQGFIGYSQSWTSNNTAIVTGTGSVWNNRLSLTIGYYCSGNQLLVTSGGCVSNTTAYLGELSRSSNNVATVTGPGSLWNCSYNLLVGHRGPDNRLEITNGGTVQCVGGVVGYNFNTSNNTAVVADLGSKWVMQDNLWVGYAGEGNRLVVTNGGTVQAQVLYVGYSSDFNQNSTLIDGGSLFATNLVDIRRGQLILKSGLLATGALWLTNGPESELIVNGGTLQTGSTIHNTGSALVVGGGVMLATLDLLDNGSHQFSNNLLIASNGVIKGSGSITGNISVGAGGTISPGPILGQLVIAGDLGLSDDSTTEMDIDALVGASDSLFGQTNIVYGGTLIVTNLSGTLTAGDSFKLFDAAGYSGSFNTVILPPLDTGLAWTNQLSTSGTIAVISTTPVTPPVFGSVSAAENNLVMSGSNGTPNASFYTLTATNVALPLANWSRVATNQFDANGYFNLTNPVDSATPQLFYRLQLP